MKKISKQKSNRISALVLLPVIAVLIAVPVLLTVLVEMPVDGTKPPVESAVTADNSMVTDSDISYHGNASDDFGVPDSSGTSLDFGIPDSGSTSPDSDVPDSGSTSPDSDVPDSDGTPDAPVFDSSEPPDSSAAQEELSGGAPSGTESSPQTGDADIPAPPCTAEEIPAFSGDLYTVINNNIPFFSETTGVVESFERYSELDSLGRCGTAFANIGRDLMPTGERGAIGHIRPSGWHTVKYEGIDGNYLYNRCHLIAWQLAGENANERNLITGTRMFNAVGMLSFEEMVGNYVRETGHHVLYRVTPMFRGENLVADGVLMEAWSVEDHGAGICFNLFVYNVQSGIVIDYATGESRTSADFFVTDGSAPPTTPGGNTTQSTAPWADSDAAQGTAPAAGSDSAQDSSPPTDSGSDADDSSNDTEKPGADYVLNTNTGKFHTPDCSSVQDMAEHNKQFFSGNREDVIAMGYIPCKRCNP